jgi:hypothetical protein
MLPQTDFTDEIANLPDLAFNVAGSDECRPLSAQGLTLGDICIKIR